MMSGSIACAKAASLVSAWVKRGDRVRVACTPSTHHFIGASTLEGLSGQPVFANTFEAGRAMDHIALAKWAELVVVCPATSNLVNKFAAGIADDAVSTLWQATWGRGIPQFVVPAMNTKMWNYPATRASAETLRSWGVHVLPTAEGDLACGEHGAGRMLEPADVIRTIDALLSYDRPGRSGRVLVTGGGTREPIDAVRYIGNSSTGRTSASLADAFIDLGLDVTWLGARSAIRPQSACRQVEFDSFAELQHELAALLEADNYDLVVHAAAVGDYAVQSVVDQRGRASAGTGKLESGDELNLRLTPHPKLLNRIRQKSRNPDVRVVGFKLTVGADDARATAAVSRLFAAGDVDLVVQNDLHDIAAGRHRFSIYTGDAQSSPRRTDEIDSPGKLATALAELLADKTAVGEPA